MKSKAEYSGGKDSSHGRRVAKVCAALVPLLAACGPQAPAEQRSVRQDPHVILEDPGPLKKPTSPQRAGGFAPSLVCKGYVVVDGNRWVENPIVDKEQADKGNYTPMTVTRQADALDISPSPKQDYLKYYLKDGTELPKGSYPICNVRFLKIAVVDTKMPNAYNPAEPNAMAFHTFANAYIDAGQNFPKDPHHVYDLDFNKDWLAGENLANIERIK